MRRTLASSAALAALALASPARANERYPASVSVNFRPGSTSDIYLGTTFGLVLSHDDGQTFYWLCEKNIGYEGQYDPFYKVDGEGTIYATTYDGLRVSRDGGCSFERATESLPAGDPNRIADIWLTALDVGPDGSVWVANADTGKPSDVYRSTDHGRSFRPLGMRSMTVWYKSLLVAPSDAQRVYVSGYQVTQVGPDGGVIDPTVMIYRTDDAGAHWQSMAVDTIALGVSPLVLLSEVAPDDPNLVFVRSVGAGTAGGDKLYRSTNGGMTWTEVLDATDAIREVVMRADGEVLAGTVKGGAFRSTNRGESFESLANPPQEACLGERGGEMFSCGHNWAPDLFALARSRDGMAWSKVFRFVELDGPLSCPVGTVQHDICEVDLWPKLRTQFAIPGPPDGPPKESGGGGGCCDARGTATSAGAIIGALLVGGLLIRRRRKRCCE